ncbi:alpha/beta fold hydrolase [Candidatus Uhrbacteria bacterium]|jgi:uncharacterized protein|nr:alpha/beta fold hydrolase [Candidatus Uhrbacteria bacterium]MBT7716851.1 alpha/beta fold hydrolase [Candidatus Uhrbacteria bacterium]
MKKVYLLHGWDGIPMAGIRPWLKQQLEAQGCHVFIPELPDSGEPRPEKWMSVIKDLISEPDEDVVLVGHSMGGQAALRYVEGLGEGQKIGKLALIAPVIDKITGLEEPDEIEIADSWLQKPMNWRKIKDSANEIVGIFSDNDPWIPLSSSDLLKEKVGADIIIEHEKEHWGDDEDIKESQAILDAIIK